MRFVPYIREGLAARGLDYTEEPGGRFKLAKGVSISSEPRKVWLMTTTEETPTSSKSTHRGWRFTRRGWRRRMLDFAELLINAPDNPNPR